MDSHSSSATPGAGQVNFALLILRVASAMVFLYHGSAILLGAFGGPGPQRFAAFMHVPVIVGYLVGLAQFGGGVAMLTGALIRVGALCIMIVMAGAMFLVHLPKGFDISKGGYEFALTEFLIAFALLLTGSGAYSLGRVMPGALKRM